MPDCNLHRSVKNIVLSGTNFWNPGDDFVRDGVIRVLRELFGSNQLNLLFYNFNADFFPQSKFAGIGNLLAAGDLDRCREHVDAVVIAGLSAGDEIKDLYRWVIANRLQDRVYLIGAGYESGYTAEHIGGEPEATIFRHARVIVGRTQKRPAFLAALDTSYAHLNCPAILSVPEVKSVTPGRQIERIGFSIQLPHEEGLVNQSCARPQYQLAVELLLDLARQFEVEVVAHHKTEYFHFLRLLAGRRVPVRFSSFYHDLFSLYPHYDLVITTRLHASLFANGHGIPGIIINDTDRHTHTLEGFPHSIWVNTRASFDREFAAIRQRDLAAIAAEARAFKRQLMSRYVTALAGPFGVARYEFDSERKEQALVRQLVRPGMTVFDAGAHQGKYTRLFSQLVGHEGNVFTFEPDPNSFARLRQVVSDNALANVTLVNRAVDRVAGRVTLHQFPEEYSSWNSLGRPQMEDPKDGRRLVPIVGSVEVEAVPLDEFCRERGIERLDYLKLDVEGAESRVLEGARGLLTRRAIGYVQFEISRKMIEGMNTTARAVFDALAASGYESHVILPDGRIGDRVGDSAAFYENYIAFPAPAAELPVHFFTIVLNGKPFIEHHIDVFRRLPFRWHWHVVEGIADLTHDTAWSVAHGGRVSEELHCNGLSKDGTTEYLDEIARRFPGRVTIHRKPGGAAWDGKLEMVNAPLAHIHEECLLWQVDADELWAVEQIIRAREAFQADPDRTAAFYFCHYFVGEDRVVTTRDTYGNHTGYEWIRTWRFTPGCRWAAHEPPRLCRPAANGERTDLATINPFRHAETEAAGLVFQHFAYATEAQLRFKETYYGYVNAAQQWERLQAARNFPLPLREYFGWVKDGALVHTARFRGIAPLAQKTPFGGWRFDASGEEAGARSAPRKVLFVRTDAIGDSVLAASMLPHIRARYPAAELCVLCRDLTSELYQACPFVDKVISFDFWKAFTEEAYRDTVIQQIGAYAPDLILNSIYSREPLTELLILSNPGPHVIGMEGDLSNITREMRDDCDPLYSRLIPSRDARKNELERHRDFLAGLGIQSDELRPQVWTTPEDNAQAEALFRQHNLDPARAIAVFPSAQHDFKIYPRYVEALRSLGDDPVVVLGGPEVEALGNEITAGLSGRCVNLAGKTSLRVLASLLRRCRLYVGADSAGAHIACAVGTPNVVVLGGGHFGRFLPYSPLTSVVCLPLACYGCNWICPHPRHHCIKDIVPEHLTEAVRQTLVRAGTKPRVFVPDSPVPRSFLDPHQVEVIHVPQAPSPMKITANEPYLVSAIVSTHNAEQYLRGCLENLEAQTIARQIEVIIIDSGSEQNERAIVEEFQRRHPNIVYQRTARETLYAAWNRGIQRARGKYITNANSDDAHRADAFERMVAALEAHPGADLAYAHTAWSSVPNDSFASPRLQRTVVYPPYHPALPLFYCFTGCFPVFRRSLFDRIGLFDAELTAAGDYEFLFRFAQAGLRAVLVPEILSLFYQNPKGLSQQSHRSHDEEEQVRKQGRASTSIHQLYRVDPADPAAIANAWVALGNLAMRCEVPWLDDALHDEPFALRCYEQAMEKDPRNFAALHNRIVTLHLCGRGGEAETLLKTLTDGRAENIRGALRAGRFSPVPVEAPPAVEPIEYVHPQPARANVFPIPLPEPKPKCRAASPAPSPELRVPVRWCGPIFNPSGYASEAINLILPLADRVHLGIYHDNNLYSETFVAALPAKERQELFALRDRFPEITGGILISHNPANGLRRVSDAVYHVGRTMFETDRVPREWVTKCNQMDEVWVPSRFNVETFAASGVERDKLVVMPEAVDAGEFDPARHEPLPLPNRAKFNFLSIFEWSSRKAWDVLLAAYLREFSAGDDVCLYLRTYLFSQPDGDPGEAISNLIREHAATLDLGNKPWPRIEILAGQVPLPELPRLYKAADCLVAPSRGEGWGRPHHEAMLMGLPVIATNWSGNTEFMTDANSYLLDFELVDVKHVEPELWHYRGHRWANPSETHLRTLMRRAQQHPDEARAKGRRARADMMTRYSREAVADLVVMRLAEIGRTITTPSCRPAETRPVSVATEFTGQKPQSIHVAWEGSFLDYGSLSHVNRELTRALEGRPGIQLTRVGKNTLPKEVAHLSAFQTLARRLKAQPPKQAQVTVRHAWPPNWERPASGAWVLIQPWEYGVLPADWVRELEQVDEVWVPSEYVRRVYVDSGVEPSKVKIVPNGVDAERFCPGIPPLSLATKKSFKFLFVGGTIHRKGPDLLLDAYLDTFTAADDVCLVIKDFGGQTVYAGQTLEARIQAAQQKPNAPEILYLNRELPADQLPALYAACDCLVHPYRGEGFGLPVLEAMACGLPVIVTGGGATDEFAGDEHAYRIPSLRIPIGGAVGGMKLAHTGWLLEPVAVSLAAQMQWVTAHRDEARVKGRAASDYVRREWTWERAAQVAAQRLQNLLARDQATAAAIAARRARKAARIELPAVARMGNLVEARKLLDRRQFLPAWNAALTALAVRPFHPDAHLLLGEVAQTAGDVLKAKYCFDRARKLAPKRTVPKLARSNGPITQSDWPSLPASADMPRLSVCLIARNEETFLGRCLESVRPIARQIVVLDTGSTDRTVEIARQHGAEVHSFAWNKDFSAARNACLEYATGDWVLMLDADEELPASSHATLLEDILDASAMAYRLPIVDVGNEEEGQSYVPRLFRNAPGLFYVGRVHEQIFSSIEARRSEWGLENRLSKAAILHHGYGAQVVAQRNKVGRNLHLLELAVEELPNEPNLLMNFGLELVRSGRLQEGIEQYLEAFRIMSRQPGDEIVPELRETLLTQLSTHLMAAREFEAIVSLLRSPLACSAGLTASHHFALGLAHMELKQLSDAVEQFRHCLAKRNQPVLSPVNRDIRRAAPHHCLAVCLARLKQTKAAADSFRAGLADDPRSRPLRFDYAKFQAEQGEPVEALKLLHELVTEKADEALVWQAGGVVALSRPELLEFARDWTGEAVKLFPRDRVVALQRAQTLLLSGQVEDALPFWQAAAKAGDPGSLAALILCQSLTGQATAPADAIEGVVSQEFVKWYRRLVKSGANQIVLALHEQLPALKSVLPTAAQWLEAAVREAAHPSGV